MLTKEKSESLAEDLINIHLLMGLIDLDYLKEFAKEFDDERNKYEGIGFISRSFSSTKIDLQRKQAECVKRLIEYINILKEIDELNLKIEQEETSRQNVDRLFL